MAALVGGVRADHNASAMPTVLAGMTLAGGLFLFLWYRTVVRLPIERQPSFIHPSWFKWGVPVCSLVLVAMGLALLYAISPLRALVGLAVAAALAFLLVRFDRYEADMRSIFQRYRTLREANPGAPDVELLLDVAAWRYPTWGHDRRVELVAGKTIESLILLMVIQDNKVHPISDWELYRALKAKAERIARP